MKRIAIASAAALSLLATSLSAQDKASDWQRDFAGLRWGSTLAEIKAAQPRITCAARGLVPTVTLATRASVDSDKRSLAARNALTKEKF